MFNNKRTDSTYLKMQDGKVVNTNNPYPTDEDINLEQQEREFYEHNNSLNNQEMKPQNKKSRILLLIGLLFILIPFLLIGLKLSKSYVSQLQEYMILGENNNHTTGTNSNTNSNNNNNSNGNSNSIINENAELINPLNKNNISEILEVTNMVNTSFKTSYSGLKTDIILFTENKESVYATTNKLQSRAVIVKSNRAIIENKKALFVKNKQEKLYDIFMQRFDILSNSIDTLESSLSRSNAVTITNNAIIQDNELLNTEITLLKELLKNNNIDYVENENGISLKD